MRFAPVAESKQSFDDNWYIAQEFGRTTTYGRHEGIDLNLKTGSDTDLGQPLYAIANGRIVYYHYGSHPTTGFGRHLVVRIDGAWGTRWCMYSHCESSGFLNAVQNVTEGQVIARLGKSGNSSSAHLHFSIWKVDPATNGGIDAYARDDAELNSKWEDPIIFITRWTQAPTPAPVTDQSQYDFGEGFGVMELQRARSILREQQQIIESQKSKLDQIRAIVE